MTNLQPETETETDTETEILTATTPPSLTRSGMDIYPPDRQKHILCQKDYVKWNGKMKKRYELYPKQLYQVITKKKSKSRKIGNIL